MTLALTLAFGGYAVVMALLTLRTARRRPTAPAPPDDALPRLAIVVAARNEEASIGRCLDALAAQDYPADRFEIVVANDHSTDGTARAVGRAAARVGPDGPAIRTLQVPDPVEHLRGKAQALHTAFQAVDAEVVLITDADCAPVPAWARAHAEVLSDPTVGVSCGVARLAVRDDRWFDRVQSLHWSIMLASVSAVAEAGMPATGMGNNMGVRRAAYLAVGGYPALPFSLTEDFTLVRAVADETDWHVRFPPDGRSVVWTLPVDGVAAAYDQLRRWAQGGLSGDPWVAPLYVVLFVVHALLVAGLVVSPVAGLAALAVKTLSDGALLAALAWRVGGRVWPGALVGMVAFVTLSFVTLPFVMALRPRVGWKGRSH